MNNIYFNELVKLAEDFEMFWHKKYYEVNCKSRRVYKDFNDYYQRRMEQKRRDTEKYNDPDIEISEEKRKMIRDSIINEKTIKKAGMDFIVFTHKTKRYEELKSLGDIASLGYPRKEHVVYDTSVIIHYEEKNGEYITARDMENLFFSVAKTKPKAIKNFEETCELINNSTIEELMEMMRNQIKENKNKWKKHFEKELEEKKKVREMYKSER